jgi:hypothetical protein
MLDKGTIYRPGNWCPYIRIRLKNGITELEERGMGQGGYPLAKVNYRAAKLLLSFLTGCCAIRRTPESRSYKDFWTPDQVRGDGLRSTPVFLTGCCAITGVTTFENTSIYASKYWNRMS